MPRILAALAAVSVVLGEVLPRPAAAQQWNDARTRALVERATDRRAQQLADTGLVDYAATAHGYLTFLAQLGEGFTEPPRVVKADELALEVYWHAPNLSKQRIVGRRDTLLLPTDISYHRDHLGIVQNNFPSIIRLGEGDEVHDVPHPLSSLGLDEYDYMIADSLSLRLPDRTIEVFEVRVRPRDDRQPRVIGAVYIDRETAEVARMALSFTRAAFLDRALEDISIVLENGLVAQRFWLPSRQEVEIRRTGKWLDYPARGIIRGRWEICCYRVNTGIDPRLFAGAEIVQAPRSVMQSHRWAGRILDSLPPDVRAVTDEDVARVQEEARRLVRAEALARARTTALSARGVSDFVRVNRVEGLALGMGMSWRLGRGVSLGGRIRRGIDDRAYKGEGWIGWQRPSGVGVRIGGYRQYRDASDEPERSLAVNSLGAQEFGSDYTEPFDVRGGALTLDLGARLGARWSVQGAWEEQRPLAIHAGPARGSYERTIPAWPIEGTRIALRAARPTSLAPLGIELRADAEARAMFFRGRDTTLAVAHPSALRLSTRIDAERPFGSRRLVLHTSAAWVVAREDSAPPQELVYLGGPVTAPGYGFHELVGRLGISQRIEVRAPIPFLPIRLGRFGRAPGAATLAPYAQAAYVAERAPGQGAGIYPSVGVGLLSVFDLLRLDVARGLRHGRWRFSVDVGRDFWGVL